MGQARGLLARGNARVPIIPIAATGVDEVFKISVSEPWLGVDTSGDPDNEMEVERVRRATKDAIESVLGAYRARRS